MHAHRVGYLAECGTVGIRPKEGRRGGSSSFSDLEGEFGAGPGTLGRAIFIFGRGAMAGGESDGTNEGQHQHQPAPAAAWAG